MDFREDFPELSRDYYGMKLTYLDSAATALKPNKVIKAVTDYVTHSYANPHRGAYRLSQEATSLYEGARDKVANLIGASNKDTIVFTGNSTGSLNLVANSYGLKFLKEGDEVLITIAEHHANLVPWQRVCEKTKATLKYMYIDEEGRIPEEEFKKITEKTKIVSINHVSNVTGRINPVKKIAKLAHEKGAILICDGSQAVPHFKVDVEDLDVDFYAFTGHKLMSFTGIGVLYGKKELLESMDPFLLGGDMIEYVEEQKTSYNTVPHKFEAGTPSSEAAVSLGAAIDYINEITYDYIKSKDKELTEYLISQIETVPHINIVGGKGIDRTGLVTFTVDDVHSHDVGWILDSKGVCVRSGHHCAQPLMKYVNIPSSTRVSLYFYNTKSDIDTFITALKGVRRLMGYGD